MSHHSSTVCKYLNLISLSLSLSLSLSPSVMAHHYHTRSGVYHKRSQDVIDGSSSDSSLQHHSHSSSDSRQQHVSVVKKLTVDLIKTYRTINEVFIYKII